jgi:hypothetical protein
MKRLWSLLVCIALVSCYSIETKDWGQWIDRDAAKQGVGLAVIFGWPKWPGMIIGIDQHGEVANGYKSAMLRPGMHIIEYSNHVHDFGHVKGEIQLNLLAGHTYEFNFDTCYWCVPRKLAVWVDDATTGHVVWGSHPDWPRWYL